MESTKQDSTHEHDMAGTRIYDTYHKMNGYIMRIWREYTFEVWQVQVILDNGKIHSIFATEYVITPNE